MIIQNKKIYSKKVILVSSIIALLVLLCVIYLYGFKGTLFGWSISTTANQSPSTSPSSPTLTSPAQVTQPGVKANSGSDQPPTPTIQADGSKVVSIAVTSTAQTISNYHIGVSIYSIQDGGTCTLNLSKQGLATLTKTVGVQALPSSSACKGFDIPMSELSNGDWVASVSFSNATYTGLTSKNITVSQ